MAGEKPIAVIKVLREHFNIGLKEAKDFVDSAREGMRPLLARELPVGRAQELARDIERAGGRVEFE
jgi:ribosomal protein L7/L12